MAGLSIPVLVQPASRSQTRMSLSSWIVLLVEPHPECYKRVEANRNSRGMLPHDSFGEVDFVLNEFLELSSIPQHLSEPNFVAEFLPAGHGGFVRRTADDHDG
jgi:hypothetical protein